MDRPYTVVWNGQKTGPGGAYLFADTVPERVAPDRERQASLAEVRETVTALLRERPLTGPEIRDLAGHSFDQVQNALHTMKRAGTIKVVAYQQSNRTKYGRRLTAVYGLS